ncbi:MAG TPA: hypothetical protein VME01_02710 [Solirubrobacteraceae bacterium]|nr:hypothetical protein [Solirubrobacteraceae bacterium]
MRFPEFLRTAVLISAASASVLAVLTIAGANGNGDSLLVPIAAIWWVIAAICGGWLGRGHSTTRQIATLLASARTQMSLPELNPARTVLNRLWPIVLVTVGAGALAFKFPQVPAIAAGFAVIWALAWRRQSAAVTAIEERDGARFYVEHTSPLRPIRLVRTPGFRSNLTELAGAQRPSGVAERRA